MDRAGLVVLMVLTVVLVQIGDSQRDTTGGRKEGDQRHSREGSQGQSPRGPDRSGENSNGTSHSEILVRLPRGSSHQREGRHTPIVAPAHAAGASREDLLSAPRDGALRITRHPASQPHRTKTNRKLSAASTRRLTG